MALCEDAGIERVAVKAICAADVLQNVMNSAKNLQVLERKLSRYVLQANLLLVCRQGNAAMKVVGSTAKTFGALTVIASSFNPKFRMAMNVGEKLWKIGTGLKVLSYIANILKELWQKGCRKCLLEFTHQTALMIKNLRVFDEILGDLKVSVNDMKSNHRLNTSEQIWNVLSNFVPVPQRVYISHVICIATGCQKYSPLFDFAALVTNPSNDSNVLQLTREIESLQFLEFARESDSNTVVYFGSFLHVTRELLDFLDGLSKLTDKDCLFLKQCLTRFTEESVKIKDFVLFLKSLDVSAEFNNIQESDQMIIEISNSNRMVDENNENRDHSDERQQMNANKSTQSYKL